MINRLTYTVIDCYWGPKESITITSNNKSFQLLIDKFRQSPCTSTSYTHVELYDGDNLIEEFTSQIYSKQRRNQGRTTSQHTNSNSLSTS